MDRNDSSELPEQTPEPDPGTAGIPAGHADDAFREFYNRAWECAFSVALQRLSAFDASDVAQRVALAFVDKWKPAKLETMTDELFELWIVRATRYQVLDDARAKSRRAEHEYVYDFEDDDSVAVVDADAQAYSPADVYNARELTEVIRRGSFTLPNRLGEVYRAVRERHQRYDQIAAELRVSEVTVRRHYQMACERLYAIAMGYITDGLIPEAK